MKYLLMLALIAPTVISCNNSSTRGGSWGIRFSADTTGSEESIRALHVIDEKTVWASGSNGTYFLSANGGESWKIGVVEGDEEDDFRSIHAWDSQRALLFGTGSPGRGYLTTTSGDDWKNVYRNESPGIFFSSLKFANYNRGIALSDPVDSTSFMIRTTDAGTRWETVTGLPALKEGEYHFAASNSCIEYLSSGMVWFITGGSAARVFRSKDNGESWEVFDTPLSHRTAASGIFSVCFTDDSNGVIVGGTYDDPEVNDSIAAWTDDGGETWNLSQVMPSEYRSCVIALERNGKTLFLAAGKTGFDYSADMGKTWHLLSETGYYTIRGIPGTYSGYAAGSDGRIAKFELFRK